mgnify:FL=1
MTHTTAQRDILDRQWYLYKFKQSKEEEVVDRINRLGFDTFAPKLKRTMKVGNSRKRKDVEVPALHGYILVGFPLGLLPLPFRQVLDLPFVHGIVGFGKFATRFRSRDVIAMMENPRFDQRGTDTALNKIILNYGANDFVRITDGPFAGFEGKVTHIKGTRVSVEVAGLMGRAVEIASRVDTVDLVTKAA